MIEKVKFVDKRIIDCPWMQNFLRKWLSHLNKDDENKENNSIIIQTVIKYLEKGTLCYNKDVFKLIDNFMPKESIEFYENLCSKYEIDDSDINKSITQYRKLLKSCHIYIYDYLCGDYNILPYKRLRNKVGKHSYPLAYAKSSGLKVMLRIVY